MWEVTVCLCISVMLAATLKDFFWQSMNTADEGKAAMKTANEWDEFLLLLHGEQGWFREELN